MSDVYKVVLADDHKLFRDGLERLLGYEEDILVLGCADNGKEAIELVERVGPDILLLDVQMPIMGGVELVEELKSRGFPDLKYIAITAFDDTDHISSLSEVGVNGYILKASGFEQVMNAIRSVGKGFPYVDEVLAEKMLDPDRETESEENILDKLTLREKESLYWLSMGLNNREIAEKMYLSDKTVKNHLSHAMAKLLIQDRTQAAIFAWRTGLAKWSPDDFK